MSRRRQSTTQWLHIPLTITLCLWLRALHVVSARSTNFTVEDDDPSIHYYPPEAWTWSWEESPLSLALFEGGPEEEVGRGDRDLGVERDRGMNNNQGSGALSEPDSSSSSFPWSTSSQHHTAPTSRRKRRSSTPQTRLRDDAESSHSPASPPPPMLRFDFTGSAIYLFAHTSLRSSFTVLIDGQPQPFELPEYRSSLQGSRPTFSILNLVEGRHSMALTLPVDDAFVLDHIVYTRDTPSTPGIRYVRRQEPEPSTSLTTTQSTSSSPSNATSISSQTSSTTTSASASPSPTDPFKKRNIATFGAAVGGSVGILALFSAGLALSIIRRRHLAKKREREDREAHPEFPPGPNQPTSRRAQVFGDEGIFGGRVRRGGDGPAPDMEERREGSFSSDTSFVPRFFPGTEPPPPARVLPPPPRISADELPPPMYNDALQSPAVPPPGLVSHPIGNHPYIHRVERRLSAESGEELGLPLVPVVRGGRVGGEDLSYADIPPSEPPPPEVTAAMPLQAVDGRRADDHGPPPPSFPEAVASAVSLPAAPSPAHQIQTSRSFYSSHSLHPNTRIPIAEAGQGRVHARVESVPLLNPGSRSRPGSTSSSLGSISGVRTGS